MRYAVSRELKRGKGRVLFFPFQAGISTADRVMTVSAGYAEEIKTWLGGWGERRRRVACCWAPMTGWLGWVTWPCG